MNTKKLKNNRLLNKSLIAFIIFLISCINVSVYAQKLIPCGRTVGITVMTDGVRVMETAEFKDKDGNLISPAAEAGIMSGDILLSINDCKITSASSLAELTDRYGSGQLHIAFLRNGEENNLTLKAGVSEDGKHRLGVWIKDSESGIGTLTYIDPEAKSFGALGHGICYRENEVLDISGGSILKAQITSVKRGERGAPGEIMGIFSDEVQVLGDVSKNSEKGIFGQADYKLIEQTSLEALETAERSEVYEGDATVFSNIEGDEVRGYEAQITKINSDESNSRGLIIKITDKSLLEKTGGIVQGMSGSPIIQDGKFVGAVTHVFVNDPTRGYGIFIENMIAEAETE